MAKYPQPLLETLIPEELNFSLYFELFEFRKTHIKLA